VLLVIHLFRMREALSALESDRDDLASHADANARELQRVREVMRGVSHAHKLVTQHDAEIADSSERRALLSSTASFATSPSPSASLRARPPLPQPVLPAPSAGPIQVRHHPNGNLSVDFGGGGGGGGAPSQHSFVDGSAPYPAAFTASSAQRPAFTPLQRNSPRVQFASDTKTTYQ
jgi:hypothetical protein